MKTDIELLEYLLGEIDSVIDNLEATDPNAERLAALSNEIYEHLGSKSIQTDYIYKYPL